MSNNEQTVADLLVEACRLIDASELRQYDADLWEIALDTVIAVDAELDADRNSLALVAILGKPLPGEEAAAHKLLLEANALWRVTEGLRFSLNAAPDADYGEVYQTLEFRLDGLSAEALGKRIQSFCEAARAWREILATRSAAPQSPTANAELMLRV